MMKLLTKFGFAMVLSTVTISVGAQDGSNTADAITITEVQAESLNQSVPAAGTVHSRNAAQITAGLAARLEWVADPGDVVTAGQTVARFDCSSLLLRQEEQAAIVDREQVRHDSLGQQVARFERAAIATSILQLEQVKADRELALREIRIGEIRLRQTENDLSRCAAIAPFDGVVTAQTRRNGEDVARGDVLLSMTDTRRLEVRAAVPIRYLPRIATGHNAQIRASDVAMAGTIRTAVPAADSASQTFEVRVDLPVDAWTQLAAGQLVSVNLPLAANAALTVPRDAIVLRSEGTYVMRIGPDQKAQSVAVEIAQASGERVAVSGDLSVGDQVAVRGAEALDDGEVVAVLTGS